MFGPLRSIKWKWSLVPLPSVLFLLPELLTGQTIVLRDSLHFIYALRRWHWNHVFADGHIPLWNDWIFNGIEHVADPQLGLYSPLSWIFFIWDGTAANQVYLLILLMAGALGMALYLRAIIKDELIALLFGAFYPLTGVVLSTFLASPFLAGICLFPWVLWAHKRLLMKPSVLRFTAMVLLLAWPMLEGDPFGSFWMSGYLFASSLVSKGRKRDALRLLGVGILAATLTAPAWLPAFDTLGQSTRADGVSYKDSSYFSVPPAQLLQTIAPAMWGRFDEGSFWGHEWVHQDTPYSKRFWHDSLYTSIPFMCLLAFGIWLSIRKRKHRLLLLFGFVYLGISLGDHFVFHPLLHKTLPFYARLRFPGKFLSYAHMFLFPLAAFALAHLRNGSDKRTRDFRVLAISAAGLYAISFFLSILVSPTSAQVLPAAAQQSAEKMLSKGAMTALAFGLTSLLLAGFSLLRKSEDKKNIVLWLFLVVGLLDLLVWTQKFPTSSNQSLESPAIVSSTLKKPEDYQCMLRNSRIDNIQPWASLVDSRQRLLPNWGLLDGIRSIYGYSPTISARFKKLNGSIVFRDIPTWARTLGVTQILTTYSPSSKRMIRLLDQGRLKLVAIFEHLNLVVLEVHPAPGPFEVFRGCLIAEGVDATLKTIADLGPDRDLAILEKGEQLFDGRKRTDDGPIQLTCDENPPRQKEIRITQVSRSTRGRSYRVQAQTRGVLVIRDNFHPGWKALVDGKQVPIARADFVNMAIEIQPGDEFVELQFAPLGYKIGNVLSLSTMAFGLCALVFLLWRRRRQS